MRKNEENGSNGNTWLKREVKRSRSAFKAHRMRVIGPGHWRIWNPKNSGNFWCDIVVMGNCGLAVWGDIDGCFFSYYSHPKTPEEVVYWMANADVSYYGRQKAHIGMGGPELVNEYVDEVAIYDIRQRLKDAKEEFGECWHEPNRSHSWSENTSGRSTGELYTEAMEKAISAIQCGDPVEMVKNALYEDLSGIDSDSGEWLGGIGRVPSSRLIYALTAVRRLGQLLRREEKKKERAT